MRANNIKYLGITLDEFLNWNEHTSTLCKSLKSFFPVFYNIKRYLNIEHVRVLYYTMLYSKIKYGFCVYGLTKLENINKIQVLQNSLLKVLMNKNRRYPTNQLHNELEILKLGDLYNQEISAFVCNFLNGRLPDVFSYYFQTFSDIHDINTRDNNIRLSLPIVKSDTGKNTVKFKGCNVWNSLSRKERTTRNPKAFKFLKTEYYHII